MVVVCVMKDIKFDKVNDLDKFGQKILDYWGFFKKLFGDMSFLSMFKEYDKDNIFVSINFIYNFIDLDKGIGKLVQFLYNFFLYSRLR